MTPRSEWLSTQLHDYILAHSSPVDALLNELAEETQREFTGSSGMQIGPDQGRFMTILTKMLGARHAVEVGTFTGYSSLCIARGLPDDGHLLCCDVSEEWTSVARRYWQRAGLAERIELRLAPALDTLRALPPQTALDLAFVDADKPGYVGYWEEIVPRLRSGGVILVDNTLYSGEVADPTKDSQTLRAIRDFNDHARADGRVELVVTAIGDGLTIARKH